MMGVTMEKKAQIKQGHIYWVNVEPHAGHEEGGHNVHRRNIRRPVVVISNNQYNQGGMSIVFPITSKQERSRYLLPVIVKHPSNIILTQILGYDMLARQAEDTGITLPPKQLAYLKEVVKRML